MTRHLSYELSREDWDVMVLHYLGLDHIGHLAGPRSPLVEPKLNEMDSIVEMIYKSISNQVRQEKVLFMLTLYLFGFLFQKFAKLN